MKTLKKMIALVLAVLMVIGTTMITSFAAQTYSITIDNALKDETYTAYKIFDVSYDGTITDPGTLPGAPAPDNRSEHEAYSYKISSSSEWWPVVTNGKAAGSDTFTANGLTFTKTSTANVYNVSAADNFSAADFAALLDANKAGKTVAGTGTGTEEGTAVTAVIDLVPDAAGYYFVDTSTGAFCSLDTTEPKATIREKNTIPTQDKKQAIGSSAPTSAEGFADTEQQVQVGDPVWYQIEVKDGKGTDADIVITDSMTNGLKLDQDSIAVYEKIGSAAEAVLTTSKTYGTADDAVTVDPTYVVSDKSDTGFKVTLKADYVKQLDLNDVVYIRFKATVTTAAATDEDAAKETNKSTLTYSHQSSVDNVDVVTYKFQLDKVQSEAKEYADLLGARFELYRGSKADANKIWFVKGTAEGGVPVLTVVGMGASAPAGVTGAFCDIRLTDSTKDTDTNSLNSSKVIFKGLDKDTYVLHETQEPDGYNIADDSTAADTILVPIDGTITDTAAAIGTDDTAVVSVVNLAGTELPSTGGMGTTILYVIGGALVLICGVMLVAKKMTGNK